MKYKGIMIIFLNDDMIRIYGRIKLLYLIKYNLYSKICDEILYKIRYKYAVYPNSTLN